MLSAIPVLPGDAGTAVAIGRMRFLVNRTYVLPVVRQPAAAIVAQVGPRDAVGRALSIRQFLEGHIQFLPDPTGTEYLHPPDWQMSQVLTRGIVQVDCDDVAMLAAALGKAVGLHARFIVVGFGSPKAQFQHVWTELAPTVVGPWIECDITRADQPFFQAPTRVKAVLV
jgi:hypothetical protein